MKKDKLVHIRLPEDIHRKVRIKCAYEDTSIQDYIKNLVSEDVAGYHVEGTITIKKKKPSRR